MGTAKSLTYPFAPKSTSNLVPGQFWAIPLKDGSYGCGRVIDLLTKRSSGSQVTFLAGILDWHSRKLPTAENIAGAKCLDQAKVHILTILRSGGCVLGQRDLELDGIEPWVFKEAHFHPNSWILRGLKRIRRQTPADFDLPLLGAWQTGVPCSVAEHEFLDKKRKRSK